MREQAEKGDHRLRSWSERFSAADGDRENKPGDALRVLSTNLDRLKRALMWLQRAYITMEFPDYDPTSERDEDLPIDLDHIVPYDVFGFDWRKSDRRLQKACISDNFRWQRGTIGNSIGNFRWLDARRNRGRGKGTYVPINNAQDLVSNPDEWNGLIPEDTDNQHWTLEQIATFQRLIDLRTLELYGILLNESGIEDILPAIDSEITAPSKT